MTKEMELIQKIRNDKELREKIVQTESAEEALKVFNEAGVDIGLDELREISQAHAELHEFYQKMTQKALSAGDKDEIPFAIVVGFVPGG